MRFQKWQALGNDYIIVERDALPFALTAARVQRLCDYHFGIGGDGVLELSAADAPGFVARLRIFNPDGSEAELSGNGAREAVMYLRASGWTDQQQFSIQTAAGEIRPTIHDERTCTLDMGRARLQSADFPSGGADGLGEVDVRRPRRGASSTYKSATRSARSTWPTSTELEALDLPAIGPAIEHSELFPNRTNVSFFTRAGRGPHPRPDLRARRGGDERVGHRRLGRRDRPRPARRRQPRDRRARRRRADRRRRREPALHAHRLGRPGLRGRGERRAAGRSSPRSNLPGR